MFSGAAGAGTDAGVLLSAFVLSPMPLVVLEAALFFAVLCVVISGVAVLDSSRIFAEAVVARLLGRLSYVGRPLSFGSRAGGGLSGSSAISVAGSDSGRYSPH